MGSLRRKKQRRSSQSISFRSSLANLEGLSPLSWGLQLWRQPSHFWRRSPRLARTILPRLARRVRKSLEKEITRQRKSKCQHKGKRLRKRKRRTLSQKKEKEMETQDDIKEDSDFEVIPEVFRKTSIYPTLPSEEQTRLWKTNLMQPENKDGNETAEKMDWNTHTSAEDMKDNNEKEDKAEAALKTMQAMGFSDDGGWLSSLLRAKSGDVSKVLDAIKPSVLDRY